MNMLLSRVAPALKSMEMIHTPSEDTAHRRERALKVLEQVLADSRQRALENPNPHVRILEEEDIDAT